MTCDSNVRRGLAAALLTTASLALAGCAGQATEANRYTLPASTVASTTTPGAVSQQQLLVRPVEVASFLDQEGIVMQMSDIELNAANQNLWAEDLGQQLSRSLRQALASDLPGVTVLGSGQGGTDTRQLSVTVDQFQGRYDGQAVASGDWQLRDGGRLLAQRRFSVSQPLNEDGYPALVRTLGEVWNTVARQIADEVNPQRPGR